MDLAIRSGLHISAAFTPCFGHHRRAGWRGSSVVRTAPRTPFQRTPSSLVAQIPPTRHCNDPGGPCWPDPGDGTGRPAPRRCGLPTVDENARDGWSLTPVAYKFIDTCGGSAADWEAKFLESYELEQRIAVAIFRTLVYMYEHVAMRAVAWSYADTYIIEGHPSSMAYWFGPYSDNALLALLVKFERAYLHQDITIVTNDWSNYPDNTWFCKGYCDGVWGGANRFLQNGTERWVWMCGANLKVDTAAVASNLMHEMSHVAHVCSAMCNCVNDANGVCDEKNPAICHCDDPANAHVLAANPETVALALQNNANYDEFAFRYYRAALDGFCWPGI